MAKTMAEHLIEQGVKQGIEQSIRHTLGKAQILKQAIEVGEKRGKRGGNPQTTAVPIWFHT